MLSQSPPVSDPRLVNKAPYIVMHRADLLRSLLSGTRKHRIVARLSSDVNEIDFSKPSLRLFTGEVHEADVILGADGERSRCKSILLGHADPPYSPGDVVHQISVPIADITEDHLAWDLKKDLASTFGWDRADTWSRTSSSMICLTWVWYMPRVEVIKLCTGRSEQT